MQTTLNIHKLVENLQASAGDAEITFEETHISWVILDATYAWKIKKPVDFGFLDFSTLEKRRFYCHEELRLNRRFAPDLYLDVVPVTGTPENPWLQKTGKVIDYSVRMKRFPANDRLDLMLQQDRLTREHASMLAKQLSELHASVDQASENTAWGNPDHVIKPVNDNFSAISSQHIADEEKTTLAEIEAWSQDEFEHCFTAFEERKSRGFVRECHGDLHLSNIIWFEGKLQPFDCLEFSEDLRWIDVINEIAFTKMDFDDFRRPDLGAVFLNDYLSWTGDYTGLKIYRFYYVYRAMVRAKVAILRQQQTDNPDDCQSPHYLEFRDYLNLAQRATKRTRPVLCITYGLSGSGKSWVARQLVARLGMIQLRSDIERKRLHGLDPLDNSRSRPDQGIYSRKNTTEVYDKLAGIADKILQAGHSVIVDATFLNRDYRQLFQNLARERDACFVILDLEAPETILKERITRRAKDKQDASEASLEILARQIEQQQALTREEQEFALTIDNSRDPDFDLIVTSIASRCSRDSGT